MKTLNSTFVLFLLGMTLNVALASVPCEAPSKSNQNIHDFIKFVETKEQTKINFSGIIDATSIDSLIRRIDRAILKNKGKMKEIVITLNSRGGNVNEATRAVRYIKNLNNDPLIAIHTKVTRSSCESACTILFTAGEKRLATPKARFGFHSPRYQSGHQSGLTKQEIEDRYRAIWLKHISNVDQTTAATIINNGYLLEDHMRFISGKDLNTGYVTDLI